MMQLWGYCIKLLAISKDMGSTIEARVHPTMIPFDNPLAVVSGPLNALTICGDAVGDMTLYGYGAGMMPTASAVVGDTVDIARNLMTGASGRVPLLSYQMDNIREIPVMPIDESILMDAFFAASGFLVFRVRSGRDKILRGFSFSSSTVRRISSALPFSCVNALPVNL